MIDGKKVLAVIPARGGSKGVPRKNIRIVAGKPLIAWTIEEARQSKYIDRLVLSSEDKEIIEVARSWGCEVPFVRPRELAQDETPGIAPVLHAIEAIPEFDIVILLQPTSPLRSAADIDGCLDRMVEAGAKACVSVVEAEQNPCWMFTLGTDGSMRPAVPGGNEHARRQELPTYFLLNGAVYAADCDWLKRSRTFTADQTVGYPMSPEHSLDIDSEQDLEYLKSLLEGCHGKT